MNKNNAEHLRECYIINGGGQRVEQLAGNGMPVPYRVEMNDWAYRSGVDGANCYTNHIWTGSFERLKEMAEEWTNSPVELVKAEDSEE